MYNGGGLILCPKCGGWGRREWKAVVADPTANIDTRLRSLESQLGVREPQPAANDQMSVVMIEAGKPRTAHLALADILRSLAGDIRICDPYYGTGSLLRLDCLTVATSVRFLTQKADGKESAFLPKAIRDFAAEHPQVEFRRHSTNDLHDRFIVTADELILLGHGLKDIGGKESFVVRLDRQFAGGTIDSVQASFDAKWTSAVSLI